MAKSKPLTKDDIGKRLETVRANCTPKWIEHPQLAWFWEVQQSGISPSARHTALSLWGFTRAAMRPVNPGVKTLAALTGYGERAIQKHLREIEDAGFMERLVGSGTKTTDYALKLPKTIMELNALLAGVRGGEPTCTTLPTGARRFTQSNETLPSYISTRDEDAPTERYVRRAFEALKIRIAKIDHNGILSRYLWHEKGFMGFMKLCDAHGIDEVMDTVCRVAARENQRLTKEHGAVKTWAYFNKEMVAELSL